MVAKLGFIVDGAGWDAANVIASLYPQPTKATIGLLNADGVTMLAGNSPTVIGSPVMSANYQTLNGVNAGYDTGVADNITKTIMVLAMPQVSGTQKSLGIGSYHAGSGTPPVPQGDTLIIDPTNASLRGVASTATGTASQSTIDGTNLDVSKFHLYFGDFGASTLQVHAFHNGSLVSGNVAGASNRAIPSSNIRVGVGYDVVPVNGFAAPTQTAAYGVWTGVNLTTAEKTSIYNTLKSMLGSKISIS